MARTEFNNASAKVGPRELKNLGMQLYSTPLGKWEEELKEFPSGAVAKLAHSLKGAMLEDYNNTLRAVSTEKKPDNIISERYQKILDNYFEALTDPKRSAEKIIASAKQALESPAEGSAWVVEKTDNHGKVSIKPAFDQNMMKDPEAAKAMRLYYFSRHALDTDQLTPQLQSVFDNKYPQNSLENKYKEVLSSYFVGIEDAANDLENVEELQANIKEQAISDLKKITEEQIDLAAQSPNALADKSSIKVDATKAVNEAYREIKDEQLIKLQNMYPDATVIMNPRNVLKPEAGAPAVQ